MNRSLEELEIRKKELKEAVDAQRNKLKLIINEYEKISTMIKEMKRSESNQENPLAKLLEKEKISRPRLQMEFKPVVHDTVDFEEEPNTKIRISKVKVSMDTFKARMVGREYIPIEDILSRMIGNDIEGDWVAIAVVYHISKKFENKLGQKIQCFDCTDLRGNCFRLFAVDMVLDQCTKGSVIAVLNCEIIKPSEVFLG
jgi:hypothetical protein